MDTMLKETYFNWLRSDCFTLAGERQSYEGVLRLLHDIPFTYILWADENRAGDAQTYRQYEFLDCNPGLAGIDPITLGNWATAAPSVLEVMLGCARRWAYMFEGRVPFYFNHMFRNMGYDMFPGRSLDAADTHRVRVLTDRWLSRQFMANGMGSPFPVTDGFNQTPDMRLLDIWSQMNAYSAEHFQG